jgi:NitT/TauT family transport system permease protein
MNGIKKFLVRSLAFIALLVIWETVSRTRLVNPFFIPPLSEVVKTAWNLTSSGVLPFHTLTSMVRAMAGFMIAVLVGVPLGVLLGSGFERFELVLSPVMEFFSQINPFIMFHVVILFLGIGESMKNIIIAWTCIWPIMFSVISGIQNIDPNIIKSGRTFGISRLKLLSKVKIPAAAPAIFTGLRISAGYSFFMLIAAEMMGCSSGLGWFILNSQENYRIPDIFAAASVIALLGLGLDTLMRYIEEKLTVAGENGSPNILATNLKNKLVR